MSVEKIHWYQDGAGLLPVRFLGRSKSGTFPRALRQRPPRKAKPPPGSIHQGSSL